MANRDDTQKIILPSPASTRQWPHLVVLDGPGVGQVFRLLRPETVIGRAADADIVLSVATVSHRHAVVKLIAERVMIEDLRSRNGTFVGVQKLKQPQELKDGDHVTIGNVMLLKLTYSVALDQAIRHCGYRHASTDAATQVSNTSHFLDRLRGDHAYARRHRTPLVVAFLRVDGLASPIDENQLSTNDDDVMGRVAKVLRKTIRTEDLLARSSHDEFVVLLRSDVEQAYAMASRARGFVAVECNDLGDAQSPVTLSCALLPLAIGAVLAPETVLLAAREEARKAMGVATNQVLRLPVLEVPGQSSADSDHDPV